VNVSADFRFEILDFRLEIEMPKNELEKLQIDVCEAVLAALGDLAEEQDLPLLKIQPPESVLQLAAEAATNVFMAFERGYRMR
jgi:hypothetical protein